MFDLANNVHAQISLGSYSRSGGGEVLIYVPFQELVSEVRLEFHSFEMKPDSSKPPASILLQMKK
jgi:hypothetical protein